MSDHQHCINCLETAEGFYSYPCQQCGWSPDQYNESGLYLSPGTILNGQYQIARMLGHGGFGITYLAWDNLLHRRLAIKEYMPRDFATRNATNSTISVFAGEAGENFAYGLERFLDEARTLAKFQQHAGIVSVLNVFYSNSTGYMVMEYVEGRTLKDYLMEKGNLSWELTLQLFMPIMDALREVHKSGILHRDISPDNIYLCNDNRVKLLDFGAARYALGGHSQSLSVVVKPGYAPEEQYRAKGKQGAWTDVYSVAASMYRCIAGVVPPDALDRLDEDELISPSDLGIPMPEKSEAALMTALAIKANDRTQNIEAFQQAIWAQSNYAEPSINKKNAKKKVAPPTASKEEPTIFKFIIVVFILTIIVVVADQFLKDGFRYAVSAFSQPKQPNLSKTMEHAIALYNEKDYKNAIAEFNAISVSRESSERDLKGALTYMGIIYKEGLGLSQDYPQAFANFMKAAELGDAEAQNSLGVMYRDGLGVTPDQQQAFNWFKKSAEQGFAFGQDNLGDMYNQGLGVNKDYQQAFNWYKKSADQGEANGQNWLGWFYQNGLGVTQNYQQAFNWYKKSAEQGFARGQESLGSMYRDGLGVNQDYQQAFNWFKKSAEQGVEAGQNSLGLMYENGHGVNQDYQQAFNLYKKSAEQGDAYGQRQLGHMYNQGFGVTQDDHQAFNWYKKAADQGDVIGQLSLGMIYEDGIGGAPKNKAEAIKWYQLAAAQGNTDASTALKKLGVK